MKFSIIIPAYNAAVTLPRCLDSVKGQPDCEILLIDDGSADETAAIAAKYGENIRILRTEHRGVSAARNRGLDLAQGEYILFLDADDTLEALPTPAGELLICGAPGDLEELFDRGQLTPVWNKVFRRDLIEAHRLRFREELFIYEDLEFVLGYLAACTEVAFASGSICRHTPSGKALSRTARLENLGRVLKPIRARLPEGSPILQRLARILAREMLAASPRRMVSICREYRSYDPAGKLLPLIRGAAALRWHR